MYDINNKIPNKLLKEMFNIIISNIKYVDKNIKINDSDYTIWKNNIQNSINLKTYIVFENNVLGYIQFIKDNNCPFICEIQIKKENQGDKVVFRKLISKFIEICKIDKNSKIFLNINPNNKKSKDVFTHIGFKNTINNKYEISGNDFLNWFYKYDVEK